MTDTDGKPFKVSRVSVASVAHVNSLGRILEFFGVNQSETRYTLVLPMRTWVVFAYHGGAPGAVTLAYFMISPSSSEPEFHIFHSWQAKRTHARKSVISVTENYHVFTGTFLRDLGGVQIRLES